VMRKPATEQARHVIDQKSETAVQIQCPSPK
jgi:hypothetical protein